MSFTPLAALGLVSAMVAHPQDAAFDPVSMDTLTNTEHPAIYEAFAFQVDGSSTNAMIYWPEGAGPHPALLMLHGFPGNEKNLDLAQVARRAGWAVMFMHYRGSWGSEGDFSFHHSAEDARAALSMLRDPEGRFAGRIDSKNVAVFGHSMGGAMVADLLEGEQELIGAMMLDPWDIGGEAANLKTFAGMEGWEDGVATSLIPLHGTSADALAHEILENEDRWSMARAVKARGSVPVFILSADGVMGNEVTYAEIKRQNGSGVVFESWPTDHSFNDRRVALSYRLVRWLEDIVAYPDH